MVDEVPWWTWLSPAGFATNISMLLSGSIYSATTGENPYEDAGWVPEGLPSINLGAAIMQWLPIIALIVGIVIIAAVLYVIVKYKLVDWIKEMLDID